MFRKGWFQRLLKSIFHSKGSAVKRRQIKLTAVQIEMLEKLLEMNGVHVYLSKFFDFSDPNINFGYTKLLAMEYVDMDINGDFITEDGKEVLNKHKRENK